MWFISIFLFILISVIIMLLDFHFQKSIYKTAEYPTLISAGFFFVPALYGFLRYPIESSEVFLLALLAGIFSFLGIYGYFKALYAHCTPGFIESIGKSQVILALLIGILFFGEHLGNIPLLGHIIILLGVAVLSWQHIHEKKSGKGIFWAFIMVVGYTLSNTLLEDLYLQYSFWSIFTPFCAGICFFGAVVALCTKTGRDFMRGFSNQPAVYLFSGLITESFGVAQFYFKNLALQTGPFITSIFLFETCIIFMILLSLLFHPIFPKYIPREGGNNKTFNILLLSIMFVGICLALRPA